LTEFRHVKGLRELGEQLRLVPAEIEGKLMRPALRQGGKVFEREIEQRIPVVRRSDGSSGELRDSVRTTTTSKNGVVAAHTWMGNAKAWYAHLIEFTGAAPHDIKPKNRASLFFAGLMREIVHHPGFRPRPIMRPVMDSQAGAAVVAVGEYLRRRLASLKLRSAYGTARTSEDIVDVS
jgi:HK97 gp10 family phage protein